MTFPSALPERQRLAPLHRVLPLIVVALARVLVKLRPGRLRAVLEQLRRGARPATYVEAALARDAVVSVSMRCSGDQGCLPRSVAIVLLCRLRGTWPTWCTGVRTAPFAAHAWVEVNGTPVGEPFPAGYYKTLMVVPSLRMADY